MQLGISSVLLGRRTNGQIVD